MRSNLLKSLFLIALLALPASSFAQDNSPSDGDATSVQGDTTLTYTIPNAYYADTIGQVVTTEEAAMAISALQATEAGRAFTVALAQNTTLLNNFSGSFFLDADNYNAGTLTIDRLVGSLLNSDGSLKRGFLDGTYDISITDNAATATFADRATQAESCTGGHGACDSYDYEYHKDSYGQWSACKNWTQSRKRNVWCGRSDKGYNVAYANSKCSGLSKPKTTEVRGCTTYSYDPQPYTPFSACKNGTKTRTRDVPCVRDDTGATVGDNYCSGQSKPKTSDSESCSVPDTYSYKCDPYGPYGACNGKHKYRYRDCPCKNDRTGATVSDSKCSGQSKPKTSSRTTCNNYSWSCPAFSGAWSACKNNSQYRDRNCVCKASSNNATVSDSNCSGTPKERETQGCTSSPVTPPPDYRLKYGQWTAYQNCNGLFETSTRWERCYDVAPNPDKQVSRSKCNGLPTQDTSRTRPCASNNKTWMNLRIAFGNPPSSVSSHCPSNAIGKSCTTLKAKCLYSRDSGANTYKYLTCDEL